MQSFMLLALFAGAALAQETCDYNTDSNSDRSKVSSDREAICIRPTYKAETEFTFSPVLPETSKFVYAIDNVTYDDWNELSKRSSSAVAVGWWIEYPTIKTNDSVPGQWVTSVLTSYINNTGSTGGGSNGCEAVLGKECIEKIEQGIKTLFTGDSSVSTVLSSFWMQKDKLLRDACPTDLFENTASIHDRYGTINELQGKTSSYMALETNNTGKFSTEKRGVMPSGNSSFTWSTSKFVSSTASSGRDLAYYLNQTAVTFIHRQPMKRSGRSYSLDDQQFTMLCTRIPQDQIDKAVGGDSNTGGSDSDNNNNNKGGDAGGAASVAGIPMVIALVLSMATVFWVGGL